MHLVVPRRHAPILGAALVAALLLLVSQTWAAASNDPGMPGTPHPVLPPAAQGPPSPPNVVSNQIIIKYKAADRPGIAPAGLPQMQHLSQAAGVTLSYFREMSGNAHVLQLPDFYPAGQLRGFAARLAALPEVEYAEPDLRVFHTLIPTDPMYGSQWHYSGPWGIDAPAAWDVTTGSSTIVVADIDTGITNHMEFSGRTVPGYDMISYAAVANDGDARDADPSDPGDWVSVGDTHGPTFHGCPVSDSSWHGTHTAGTIGAMANNGIGVVGINWNSKILPVRVLGKCGGYTSDIEDGMRWAAGLTVPGVPANSNPAQVLSLSLGGGSPCTSDWQSAIDDVNAAGAVVVVAAGNENTNANTSSPGNCNGVITVAATDRDGYRAPYSNYGSVVEIAAPGGDMSASSSDGVLSTMNSGTTVPVNDTYAYYQGTSMATPHVTGVVSLLFSLNPYLTPTQVLQILQSTAKSFPAGGTCTTSNCGAGIVDAGAAVHAVPPTITGFTPTSGFIGTVVSISGANFMPTTAVRFNGTSATFSVVSASLISATVPVGATTGPISVTIPAGTATSSPNFTVLSAPTITSFSPTRGSVGTTVTVTGTSFIGATSVQFNGTNAAYTVLSTTSISTTVPAGATTGPIRVTTPAGSATSASNFVVLTMPAINTVIRDAGETAVTSALVGTSVHDHATITGAAGTPTGSATFALYGTTDCSGTFTSEPVALNSGAAASSATTVPATGLSYRVSYDGDINYAPATGTCEPLTAIQVRGVTLQPPSAAQSGDPGMVVTYTLTLTNTGSAIDSFTLASSGNAWTTVKPSSVGPLAAGVGANVAVSVTIPTSALAGASDTAMITATSQGDATKMASATLTTTANAVRNLTLAPPSAAQSGLGGATITYTLTLTNTSNIADSYNLTLGYTVFDTHVSPGSAGPLNPGASVLVTVTVQIPSSASGGSSDTAVVTATSQANPSKSAGSALTTSVPVVRGAALAPPSSSQAGNPGIVVTYTLTLTNTGNVVDSYSLAAGNNAFPTNVTPSSVSSLAAGSSRPVTATVQIPANAGGGTSDTAILTATSQGDVSKKATSTLTTNVNTTRGVTLSPSTAYKSGNPGEVVTYTLRITNTGNVADSFNLHASGSTWTTTYPASVGPLAMGVGTNAVISVTVPLGSAEGATDSVNLSVVSAADSNQSASASLTTTANPVRGVTLLPAASSQSGNPGTALTYTFTLTNTGNASDTFNIGITGAAFPTEVDLPTVGPLSRGASQVLTVSVDILPGAAGASVDIATVTATSVGDGSKSAVATTTTTVNTIRGTLLAPTTVSRYGDPGAAITHTLTLTNTGNAVDSYTLAATGNTFSTVLQPSSVSSLGAGASRTITVTVQIPGNAGGGTSDAVTVTATSQGDASKKATSTLTTNVNALYGATIAPASASKTADPGATVSFTLRVTNTGNIVDTFTLTAIGNSWPTNLPASVGPLNAGAGADVDVSVIIPGGAAPGASDSATLTATSQGDNTRSASAVVTTNTRRTPAVTTAIHDDSHNIVTTMPIGTSVHDRAVVAGAGPIPTGTITFTVYANMACSGSGSGAGTVTLASGVAHPSASAVVTSGGMSFKARYGGDANYTAADSACEMLTAVKSDTTLTLSSSANPSLLGQSVTFTAQVSDLVSLTPTGTVTFTIDGVQSARPLSNGTASYSTSALAAGTHAVVATYGGDTDFNGSADNLSQDVNNPMPVLTAISPTSAPVGSGDVTLTVTGTNFLNVSVVRWNGNARATTFVSGTRLTATILASDLVAVGTGSVTVFNPAPGGGETDPRTFNVGQVTTIVTVTSSKNPAFNGEAITLTATVTAAGGATALRGVRAVRAVAPSGTVIFYDVGNALATRSLDANGVATYTTSTLVPGTHTLSAAYSGDAGHGASTSTTLSQVIQNISRLFLPFIRR